MNQFHGRMGLGILILFSLVLTGCGIRFQATQKAVETTAAAINADFENVRKAEETMVSQIENVYANTNKLDLSLNKMDVKDGGVFAYFDKYQYYYKTEKTGASYYCSPGKPLDNTLKREIRIMQYLEDYLAQAYEKEHSFLVGIFYAINIPATMGMIYPWTDVVSFLPPGLNITFLEWYTRGLNSSGPAIWSKLPFVSLYGGWVEDVAIPVMVNGKVRGVAVLTLSIDMIKGKYINNQKNNIMLLGPDTTLVAANKTSKSTLELKVIEDVDYVKQMKENKFAASQYKLSDASQTPEMQAAASKILAGEKKFEQKIKGKTYLFAVSDIKEVGFYLVGFTLK